MAQVQAELFIASGTPGLFIGTSAATTGTGLCHDRLRCLHITMIIFGCIQVSFILLSIALASGSSTGIFGLFLVVTGILGIVAGAMINPCGFCSDPGPGTVKCIAIISYINSVLHAVVIVLLMIVLVMILMSSDDRDDDRADDIRGLVIIGSVILWYFINFIICAAAGVVAWQTASKMSAAPSNDV